MVSILIAGVAIAMICFAVKYLPIAAAKSNPERDAMVQRDKWIANMMHENGYCFGSRQHQYMYARYGDEYDALVQSGQQPPIP
jgi:hypothetical protein